jgi:UDP:flavonoid glycosyltransferase YjiC (YdhE family)
VRIAVVAGPDPGHAFPALALCARFLAAGDEAVLFTGTRWLDHAREAGIDARELRGLALAAGTADVDAGRRLHERAASISTALLHDLGKTLPDLVVSDVITAGGSLAAERLGIPWVELSPHPLYLPSRGLPPLGSGLAVGTGVGGRLRDVTLRAFTARDIRAGAKQRRAARRSVGLPDKAVGPRARLVATLPALEVPRPDWPQEAHVVGPLFWEPSPDVVLEPPPGDAPLVFLSASTAASGEQGLLEVALDALAPAADGEFRLVTTVLGKGPEGLPAWARVGPGRQDLLLAQARVVVCGGGHGMVSKGLLAGLPVVAVPGGGDQWELSTRVARQGSGVAVRPLTAEALRAAVLQVLAESSFPRRAREAAAGMGAVADAVQVCHAAARQSR